jgi:cell shape-determining protein MreD
MPRSGLLLPGEHSLPRFRFSRAALAGLIGFMWLPIQASLTPALGMANLPFDPILPLIAAFALGGRTSEAWLLAIVLGYVADFYVGLPSGRLLLQYSLVVLLATPLHGKIVLRDRFLPVVGVAALAAVSSVAVLLMLGAMGSLVDGEISSIPSECFGTSVAALLLWPLLARISGLSADPRTQIGPPK